MPSITVSIKNNTDSTIQLVKALDGSNVRWRFPYAYFKIEKISDTTYKARWYKRCGNYDAIKSADFIKIESGSSFNPYTPGSVYSDYTISDKRNFEREGKYRITFYYSTNETDFKKWLGDYNGVNFYFDNKIVLKSERKEEYQKLLDLFTKVPKMDIVSNELIIEIE